MSAGDHPDVLGLAGARLARLRAELESAPYDALVLTSPESVFYATGYLSIPAQLFPDYPMAAFVSPTDVALVVPSADSAAARESGGLSERISRFGRFFFEGAQAAELGNPHDDMASALRNTLGAVVRTRGRIGLEAPPRDHELRELVSEVADVVDANQWMRNVRSVKLPGEQALLRRAAELAEDGIEAALAIAKTGVTERELAAELASAMVAGGGAPRFLVVTSGPRSALSDAWPTDRPLQRGDLLRFDVGCVVDGYWSDIARTAVVGDPSPRQQQCYDAILAGLEAEFEAVRPGVRVDEVFATAIRAVEANALEPYRRHHVGHAIGLSVYEPPIVTPLETGTISVGTVLCLETPYYELGWGGMMAEDTGVVTDDGLELFTSIDRSLRVLPA